MTDNQPEPEGAPTVSGELAKVVGVAGAPLILFPSLVSFGDSAAEGWWRVALVLAIAFASALGLRWTLLALVIGSAVAWALAEHFHPAAVGSMILGLVLGLVAVAMTPTRRPAYRAHDPRRVRIVTLVAVFFFWIPFVGVVLAHIAELGAKRRGALDGRVAVWTRIVAWGVTLIIVMGFLRLAGQIQGGEDGSSGEIVGKGRLVATWSCVIQ